MSDLEFMLFIGEVQTTSHELKEFCSYRHSELQSLSIQHDNHFHAVVNIYLLWTFWTDILETTTDIQ